MRSSVYTLWPAINGKAEPFFPGRRYEPKTVHGSSRFQRCDQKPFCPRRAVVTTLAFAGMRRTCREHAPRMYDRNRAEPRNQ